MNRIKIERKQGGKGEFHSILQNFANMKLQNSETIIHYKRPGDMRLSMDEKLRDLIIISMRDCKITISIFDKSNTSLSSWKKHSRELKKWIEAGLKNPLIPEDVRQIISKIKIRDLKKDSQFTSEIADNLKQIFTYLIETHKFKPKECRSFLLELLQEWFPENKKFQELDDNTFEKALNRSV